METKELWGKGWSLRTEQDPRAMTYLGTITKSGIQIHYYRDDDVEINIDNEPEDGKPDWMERADRKLRNRAHKKK